MLSSLCGRQEEMANHCATRQTTDTIAGGTAGAVRAERAGIRVGGRSHSIKAAQRARQLSKLIARGKFSGNDLALAKAVIQDLMNSLAGR